MSNVEPAAGQLIPINDCVLVELQQSYNNLKIKEGKYDTRTEGIVVKIPREDKAFRDLLRSEGKVIPSNEWLMGKRVHFEEFKEGARIKRDGKVYSFIKIEDIRGYESV